MEATETNKMIKLNSRSVPKAARALVYLLEASRFSLAKLTHEGLSLETSLYLADIQPLSGFEMSTIHMIFNNGGRFTITSEDDLPEEFWPCLTFGDHEVKIDFFDKDGNKIEAILKLHQPI